MAMSIKELIPDQDVLESELAKNSLIVKATDLRYAGFLIPARETLAVAHGFLVIDGEKLGKFALSETPVAEYKDCPPEDVIRKVQFAKQHGIFDSYIVYEIKNKNKTPENLLVGRILESNKRFFIAHWR